MAASGIPLGHADAPPAAPRLAFACNAVHLPAQEDVARLFGTHNFGQTYRARERLLQEVRSACRRGAGQVLVEADVGSETRTASVPPLRAGL